MKTLYEQFMECKEARNADVKDNPLIIQQLIALFQQSYGISEAGESLLFKNDVASIGQELRVDYKFKYGFVSVGTLKGELVVTFHHKFDGMKVPFEANRCTVFVDHDLNFIRAEYCTYFSFLNSVIYNKPNYGGYNQMKIQRIIDLNGSYNQLSFCNSADDNDEFIDTDLSTLDNRFVTPNTALEEAFIQVIDVVTEYPNEFYSVFEEYPSFSKCVESSKAVIEFVNLFVEQYFSDNEKLKQNMLLFEMQAI